MSEVIHEAIMALGGYHDFYSSAARSKNPNGLHRLAHLVPEVAPDQAALARKLAELAVGNRGEDYHDPISLAAYRDFEKAKGNDARIERLARRAPDDGIAWQACALFLEPERRQYLHQTRCKNRPLEKRIAPIPEPIQNLMEQHFRGEIDRPDHSDLELRNAAIIFAVRFALEAKISATSGNPNACQIVGELLDIPDKTIRDVWQQRSERPRRGPRH